MLLTLTAPVIATNGPVVFYSPQGEDVSVDKEKTKIIITFQDRMMQKETENAFSIKPETPGSYKWNDRNLTFSPNINLAPETTYVVEISKSAKNINGVNLVNNFSWSFRTAKNTVKNNDNEDNGGIYRWSFWEPIVTGLTIIGTVSFALFGIWKLRKRRSKLKDYITRLDDVYDKYRKDPYVCEHKLTQLKESLKIKFKSGEMEENHYLIMDKKIDDYLTNIRYRKKLTKPKIIGGPEGEIREELEKQLMGNDNGVDIEPEQDKESDLESKAPPTKKSKKKKSLPKIIPDK